MGYPFGTNYNDSFYGVVSSRISRISVFWTGAYGAPCGTKDSQWSIAPGEIKLYNNSSEPYKNMQNITFICEFDSSVNLAPCPGGYNAKQAAGSDPRPLILNPASIIVPSDKYIGYQDRLDFTDGEILFGTGNGTTLLTAAKLDNWIPYSNYPESDWHEEYIYSPGSGSSGFSDWVNGSGYDEGFVNKFYKGQILYIKTSGDNQGYYEIQSVSWNGSKFEITIDPTGEYGGLYKESGLSGNILSWMPGSKRFAIECIDDKYYCSGWVSSAEIDPSRSGYYYYPTPNNITQQFVDIQTELQENANSYTAEIIINPIGGNLRGSNALHVFQIVPYWLIESKIETNEIIPTWQFKLKSIIREIDRSGTTISGYWKNFYEP